jgi:hypothetical protein
MSQDTDKYLLKCVLEEMLAERNPLLLDALEQLIVKVMSDDLRSSGLKRFDLESMRQQYRINRASFAPLHEIFYDAPDASVLVKMLSK